MKRISFAILCLFVMLLTGCDTDIATEDVDKMTNEDFCGLTGGQYDQTIKRCKCGGVVCGENVNCGVNAEGVFYCLGYAHQPFPSGTCMINGETMCNEIAESNSQAVGYYVKCENNVWSDSTPCTGGASCKYDVDNLGNVTTSCGECQNGSTCVNGRKVSTSNPGNDSQQND